MKSASAAAVTDRRLALEDVEKTHAYLLALSDGPFAISIAAARNGFDFPRHLAIHIIRKSYKAR